MAHGAGPAGAELLHEVEKLAAEGYGKGEIAQRLGFKNPATFSGRLIRASQQTGKPIPAFRGGSRTAHSKRVETVEIRRRGRGATFGVNVPQEPLDRIGAMPGDSLTVTVNRGRIVLFVASQDAPALAPASGGPRLVKNRKGA